MKPESTLVVLSVLLGLTVCGSVLTWKLSRAGCPLALSATVCNYEDDKLVQWNSTANICEPDVCNNVDLSTMPDVSGHAPPCVIQNMQLYDAKKARKCLASKRLLLLGDSTMSELGLDLQILLSGSGADSAAVVRFVRQCMTPGSKVKKASFPEGEAINNAVATQFYKYDDAKRAHHHYRVTVNAFNISILHRYTGHHEIDKWFGGIQSFSAASFQGELGCLLGEDPACELPNIILCNSGLHDAWSSNDQLTNQKVLVFEEQMWALAQRLMKLQTTRGVTVAWVGTKSFRASLDVRHNIAMGLDRSAQLIAHQSKLQYIDMAGLMSELLPQGRSVKPYTRDGKHWGAHAKANGKLMTVSTLLTQRVLAALCS